MQRASASGATCGGFDLRPRHTRAVKMVPVATFLGAQHYMASTGSRMLYSEKCLSCGSVDIYIMLRVLTVRLSVVLVGVFFT